MSDDPYIPPKTEPLEVRRDIYRVGFLGWSVRFLGCYLLGILCCVAFTSVDMNLAGVPLWVAYPFFAPLGFVAFIFMLTPGYTFGGQGHWLMCAFGASPILCEIAAWLWSPKLGAWRPLWIGFPIGFVGAAGVYFAAAQSI